MGIKLDSKNVGGINFDSRSVESIHYGGDLVWSGSLPSGTVLFEGELVLEIGRYTLTIPKAKKDWSNVNRNIQITWTFNSEPGNHDLIKVVTMSDLEEGIYFKNLFNENVFEITISKITNEINFISSFTGEYIQKIELV